MTTAALMRSDANQTFVTDLTVERLYSQRVPAEHRRKYGQVFTPPKLASLMADWVMGCSPRTLLDPAYGTGLLVEKCLSVNKAVKTTAYEIDPRVLENVQSSAEKVDIQNADFLRSDIRLQFDAIVMNPPYIRHREVFGYDEVRATISASVGIAIPKSANLYIYFSLKALSLLAPGGRAAILIPAEWMSANFSKLFKQFLIGNDLLKGIVLFSSCSNVFDDALTTASVLLCEK